MRRPYLFCVKPLCFDLLWLLIKLWIRLIDQANLPSLYLVICWSRAFSCWPVRWTQWTFHSWMKLLWGAFGCCRYIDCFCWTTFLQCYCCATRFSANICKCFLCSSLLFVLFLTESSHDPVWDVRVTQRCAVDLYIAFKKFYLYFRAF